MEKSKNIFIDFNTGTLIDSNRSNTSTEAFT